MRRKRISSRQLAWVIIGVAMAVTLCSFSLANAANSNIPSCIILNKGALVGEILSTGNIRIGLHPAETKVSIIKPMSDQMVSQMIKVTKVTDWTNGQMVSFNLPDNQNPGIVREIFLYVRLIDLRKCT